MDKRRGNRGHSLHRPSRVHPRLSRGKALIIVVVLSIGFWRAIWEGLSSLGNWMLGIGAIAVEDDRDGQRGN
jgi:hypothetical protein